MNTLQLEYDRDFYHMKINIFKIIILLLLGNIIAIANPNNGSIILSVTIGGTASGTVTSDIIGINCGKDCNEFYNLGTKVLLTAISNINSTFNSWAGCVPLSDKEKCVVTMDTSKKVKAIFTNLVTTEQKQKNSDLAKKRVNAAENYLKKIMQEKEAAYEKSKEYWIKLKANRIAKKEAEIKAAIEVEKLRLEQLKIQLEGKVYEQDSPVIDNDNIDYNVPETEIDNHDTKPNSLDTSSTLPEPTPDPKPEPIPHPKPEPISHPEPEPIPHPKLVP